MTGPVVTDPIRLFLCGDVMTGRGIDQALPHPAPPHLYESYADSAQRYVELAEEANGPIARPLGFADIWGAASAPMRACDARIINLETAITLSEDHAPKGINYRMSPANAPCLAGIDGCALANNHVLDWGRAGLLDTLAALDRLGIRRSGAGRTAREARAPAVLEIAGKGRVLVFACATTTSGTPRAWAAGEDTPGVHVLPDLSDATVTQLAGLIRETRGANDVVVVSVHWGPNWGYEVPAAQRRFAQALIERAEVAVVHGHSSHHPKAIEVHRGRLILYGCGDFLNDYEGIAGYAEFRGDLALMYLASIAPDTGALAALDLVPLRIARFRLVPASAEEAAWLQQTLDRESRRFGTRVRLHEGRLAASWAGGP